MNQFADQLARRDTATAAKIRDQITANGHMLASIENGYAAQLDIIRADYAQRNESLEALAKAIEDGEPVMPAASPLASPAAAAEAAMGEFAPQLGPSEFIQKRDDNGDDLDPMTTGLPEDGRDQAVYNPVGETLTTAWLKRNRAAA